MVRRKELVIHGDNLFVIIILKWLESNYVKEENDIIKIVKSSSIYEWTKKD